MEMDEERKARLEKMVTTAQLMLVLIKGVVDVGVVLSLKPILKSWQLCLSFKLDVPTRNVLLSAQMGERASVVLICIITSRYNEVK